ncbi:NAD-dependent epimerase/dehydratase family protein [Pseudomonas sp. NPDC047961]
MYMVTGASGAVGSAIVNALAEKNAVVGLSRQIKNNQQCIWVNCDLIDDVPDICLKGVVVIHCAGEIRSASWDDHWNGNVKTTKNILDWAVKNKALRFIYISSGAVYGEKKDFCFSETDEISPRSSYAVTKHLAEQLCRAYQMRFGLPVVIHRLYFPYGPGQTSGLIRFLSDAVAEGREVTINKDGGPVLSLTPIDDVISAVMISCKDGFPPGTYNLCGQEALSITHIVSSLEFYLGKKAIVKLGSDFSQDILGNNAKLMSSGWKPVGSFEKYLDQFDLRRRSGC